MNSHMCQMEKKLPLPTFENIAHSKLVIFVNLAVVSMLICVEYDDSMIKHKGRRTNYRKKKNGCHLKQECLSVKGPPPTH